MSAEVTRTKRIHFPSLPPPPFTTTAFSVIEAYEIAVHDRHREKDTGLPRDNEEWVMERFARHRYRSSPLPDTVDSLSPVLWVDDTDEENTDPPYGIPHNEEGRYETFEVYSYTFPEAPTDLSAFMAGVTPREKPVRSRSKLRRPDG